MMPIDALLAPLRLKRMWLIGVGVAAVVVNLVTALLVRAWQRS